MSELKIHWRIPAAYPLLRSGEVHLWAAPLDGLSVTSLSSFRSLLSSDERARADRFKFDRDGNRFVATRAMLRTVLGQYQGIDAAQIIFAYSARGKPSVNNDAPASFHFNVSHSENLGLLAVSKDGPLGIDVERVHEMNDMDAVAERVFTPAENAARNSLPTNERIGGFFDLWTRKESVLKATGEGITELLQQIEVLSAEEKAKGELDCQETTLVAGPWIFHRISPAEGFKASLAVAQSGLRVISCQWSAGISLAK